MDVSLLRPLNPNELQVLSRQFKQALADIYGNLLDRVVLFGSYARGDFRADSDVDFLVVIKQNTVQFGTEVDKISIPASQIGLDFTVQVSAKPVSASSYYESDSLFYKAVRTEGITI